MAALVHSRDQTMPASTNGTRQHTDIDTYFDVVHKHTPPDAVIGLTTIIKSYVSTRWYQRRYLERLIADVLATGDRMNVYVRITPLAQPPESGRGVERQSLGASVLFVDCDAYDNQMNALAALNQHAKPPTLVVSSGNGLHAYWLLSQFETDIDTIKAANKQLTIDINHIDPRADADACFDLARVLRVPETYNIKRAPIKCTIVAYNPDRIYKLTDFARAPLDDESGIAVWDSEALPADFIEGLRERDAKLAKRIVNEETARKADAPIASDGSIDRSRNDAYIATRLLALGYSAGVALAVLQHDQWLSGAKYRERMRFDYVVATVNAALRAYQSSPERYFNKTTFIAERLGGELHTQRKFIYAGERLWRYDNGVYVDDGEEWIKARTIERLGTRWNSRARDETIQYIIDQSRIDVERLNQHEGIINCRNGMLHIASGELLPHDPKYLSTAQIPAEYDPNADTSMIDAFVGSILPADAVDVFWQYIGSAFLTGRYWPKAFLALIGPPDSGKSKLAEWVFLFFGGKQNVTTLSLQTLADNKFATAVLFGKLANVFSDLDESEAQNTGQIKSLTGDDYVSGEQKFKGFFMFKNTARLLFTANAYPSVRNPDNAFFRRAMIIPCNNRFAADDPKTDPAIVDKMVTPANMNAGLLRAMRGLQQLLARGSFSDSASIATANNDYRFAADTVAGFIAHKCEPDADFFIPKSALYALYRSACEIGRRPPVSEDKFYKRIADNLAAFGMRDEYKTITANGRTDRVWCYVGVRPRDVPTYAPYMVLN